MVYSSETTLESLDGQEKSAGTCLWGDGKIIPQEMVSAITDNLTATDPAILTPLINASLNISSDGTALAETLWCN
jgi:hypothetical protein